MEKLSSRGFEPALIADVIDELAAKNLQSDERFADLFVEQRINKGFGELKIRAELQDRGVDQAVQNRVFSALDVDWLGVAKNLVSRKYRNRNLTQSSPDGLKCKRFLYSRGFTAEQIQKVFVKSNQDG